MTGEFKSGDVVRLKSGGPKMTVENVNNDNFGKTRVHCVWFWGEENKQERKTGSFPPDGLERP